MNTYRQRFKSVEQRFREKVGAPTTTGCTEWLCGRFASGYGQFSDQGKNRRAHRVAWELAHGPIPDGLVVCHKCDNPACVNVGHLFLGTNNDNVQDRNAKGRQNCSRGEHHGSRLHPERVPRGEQNGSAKLPEQSVLEIKAMLAQGAMGTDLARRFSVSTSTISNIKTGKGWKHLGHHLNPPTNARQAET